MSAADAYERYAVLLALQAAKEAEARPKVTVVAEPPEPLLTRHHFDPVPTLH